MIMGLFHTIILFVTNNMLWSEGLVVLVVLLAGLLFGAYYSRRVLWISLALLLFSFYFFRNPDRICPRSEGVAQKHLIVAPADGRIISITSDIKKVEGYAQRISIFLSLFDVHVNRVPVSGVVKDIFYSPGFFTVAYRPKSSVLNERNDIIIERDNGSTVKMRQIAGSIARKICCWVIEGQQVEACERIGMIRFGSRVDLFLPPGATLVVRLGQQVYGGQTVIGFFQA